MVKMTENILFFLGACASALDRLRKLDALGLLGVFPLTFFVASFFVMCLCCVCYSAALPGWIQVDFPLMKSEIWYWE